MSLSFSEIVEGFQAVPELTVSERYDDNIQQSRSPRTHDFMTSLIPRMTLSSEGTRGESSLSYQAEADFYRDHPELNTVRHVAGLDARYRLSNTTELKIQDRFVNTPDTTDISPTRIIPIRTKQYDNSASALVSRQFSRMTGASLEYSYEVQRYQDPNLIDGTVQGVQLAMTHELTPMNTLKAAVGFRYFSFGNETRQHVYNASLGWTHPFSETFVLDLNGGANLYQDPNHHYSPSASADAALTKSWRETRATLRYLRDLTIGGGQATSAVINQSAVASIQATLSQNLSASFSGSYATNQSIQSTSGLSIDTAAYGGTAGLDYAMAAWLKGRIQYSYIQQNSHGAVGNQFRRNQILVGLTATFPEKLNVF